MARVLAVQSREIWQVATGSLSDQLEPSRPIRPHVLVKKMSGGLRMSFRILLTTRTDCLCCLQLRTLLLCVCGPLLCMFGHDVCMYVCVVCVLRARTATVQQQSHSKYVWNACVETAYIYTRGPSPRRADARLGPAQTRNC